MKLPTVTMRYRFSGDPADAAANTAALDALLQGSGFYVADPDTPACGEVAYVPADATTDGIERMFVCDRPADHPAAERHRQVINGDEEIEWGS